MNWLARTEVLIGADGLERLLAANVLIVGLGGVGSYAAEYIARAGIGRMTIIDGDTVEFTNRNRQLCAVTSSEGISKAEWMAQRLLDINPELHLTVINDYMVEEKISQLLSTQQYDYAMDCIDTISPKMSFIKNCLERKIPLVSAMGAGGKLDPEKIRIAPINKTYNCPMAQHLRKTMKHWKLKGEFKAVFSSELPDKERVQLVEGNRHKKSYYGTISYIPSLFGAFAASVVIRDLISETHVLTPSA